MARQQANAVLSGLTPGDTWRAGEFIVEFAVRQGACPKGVTFADIHAFVHSGKDQIELPVRAGVHGLVAKASPANKAELYALLALIVALLQLAVDFRPHDQAPQLTPEQIQEIVDEIIEEQSHLPGVEPTEPTVQPTEPQEPAPVVPCPEVGVAEPGSCSSHDRSLTPSTSPTFER
jgi:hypothetical protein